MYIYIGLTFEMCCLFDQSSAKRSCAHGRGIYAGQKARKKHRKG